MEIYEKVKANTSSKIDKNNIKRERKKSKKSKNIHK